MMGTIGWGAPAALHAAELTTPDVITVHRRLASLRALGVHNVVMEVSSHALDQGRVDGVRFASALFTNLSRDHLDYHCDMHAYGEAKARLFQWSGLQMAAINVDDDFGARLFQSVPHRVRRIAISRQPGAQPDAASAWLAAPGIETRPAGLAMEIRSSWGAATLNSRLLGRFNASNLLLALAVLLDQGVDLARAAAALGSVAAPPGRMQALATKGRGPLVIIDFAHTPDALEKALGASREHCRGTLWCVFGAGGDRDRGKRPLMGQVASGLADCLVITSDNPRHEDPLKIIRDIRQGVQGAAPVEEFVDRARAIAWAIERAGPRDVVLVAGKGHERYQQWGDERRPYSDEDCARAALEGRT
jgi:UDP-N-acetylmuramoyl-L-alanyl-D-glutamate--2,6-diaminopimelate ligase